MKRCSGWKNFCYEVMEQHIPVVCFGAGMMGIYIEHLFIKEGVWRWIDCFLDNDPQKWGTSLGRVERKPVTSIDLFMKRKLNEFIVLITCVTYIPIIEQLNQLVLFDNIHCYIYPEINYQLAMRKEKNTFYINCHESEYIPRIIHYCWFGKEEKSELIKKCIESWKKYCPDYQIIEWNEENYDYKKNKYMLQAYKMRKWAYVTDYARMDILYNCGGIYFDTDVEILNNIDILLTQKAFIAYGEWPTVNSGAGVGSIKGHLIIKEIRDEPRSYQPFIKSDGNCDMTQNGVYESDILEKYGYSYDFKMQYIKDMLILPPEYMATSSVIGERIYVSNKTLTLHHNRESWADSKRKEDRKRTMNNLLYKHE